NQGTKSSEARAHVLMSACSYRGSSITSGETAKGRSGNSCRTSSACPLRFMRQNITGKELAKSGESYSNQKRCVVGGCGSRMIVRSDAVSAAPSPSNCAVIAVLHSASSSSLIYGISKGCAGWGDFMFPESSGILGYHRRPRQILRSPCCREKGYFR